MHNLIFLSGLITNTQDTYSINVTLLAVVAVLLLIALSICIMILNKHHLYNRPRQQNITVKLNSENEVA